MSGPWATLAMVSFSENDFMNWQAVEDINLSAYIDQQIYLSFFTDTHHYYWRIDNIAVAENGFSSNDDEPLPVTLSLEQNYPNPLNAGTTIEYNPEQPSAVSLAVYDITGRLVVELVSGHSRLIIIEWNGTAMVPVNYRWGPESISVACKPVAGNRLLKCCY